MLYVIVAIFAAPLAASIFMCHHGDAFVTDPLNELEGRKFFDNHGAE